MRGGGEVDDIIEKILSKIHSFGVEHFGESPTLLYVNREQSYELKASDAYRLGIAYIDHPTGRSTIFGMRLVVDDKVKDIEVR